MEYYLLEHCGLSKLKQVNVCSICVIEYRSEFTFVWILHCLILLNSGYPTGLDMSSTANLPGKDFFFLFFSFHQSFSCYHVLIGLFLPFVQDVPAQEQNDNQFLPTLPPLRTAVPMLALEAPKARRPAAWHEIMVTSTTSRTTISRQSHLYGFCAFVFFSNA